MPIGSCKHFRFCDTALCCAGWSFRLPSSFLFSIHSKLDFGQNKTRLEENKPIMFRDGDLSLVKFVKAIACYRLYHGRFSGDFQKISAAITLRTYRHEQIVTTCDDVFIFLSKNNFTKINLGCKYQNIIINDGRYHNKLLMIYLIYKSFH